MEGFRFSPIKNKEELLKAITHLHFACNELCRQVFGEYLLASGNIGVFCHFPEEYEFLTSLRKEMTYEDKNWNKKYYFLREPIIISESDGIPGATYTYLYIRRFDVNRQEVGDIDFVIDKDKFEKFKEMSHKGVKINEVEIFYRPDLDMLWLSHKNFDVLPYVTTTFMTEKGL